LRSARPVLRSEHCSSRTCGCIIAMLRMPLLSLALPFSIISIGFAGRPIEKVINLLTDLKTTVTQEGVAEALTYDTFACFCRSTTSSKSTSVTTGKDNIETHSGEIEVKTALREGKITELNTRTEKQAEDAKDLKGVEDQRAKSHADYLVMDADLTKAKTSLDNAIQAMTNSKPALLSIQSIQHGLALAQALGLVAESRRLEVSSFLQGHAAVDPSDPGYKYHSQGIIDILSKLLLDFTASKTAADAEWAKTKLALDGEVSAFELQMQANGDAMFVLKTDIGTLKGEIADARDALMLAEGLLKDDQLYLKDLTERCELRAKDWDQRSQLRSEELTELTKALTILTDDVRGKDTAVNDRTVLIERETVASSPMPHTTMQVAKVSRHLASPSFLQEGSVARSLLRGAHSATVSSQAKKDKAVSMLRDASQRLRSTTLSSVAMRVAADPFTKVKDLIQKLIERLLKEATMEATKKGFCDEQLGTAKQDRDYRSADTEKLNLELKFLEVKEDELVAEIELMTEALRKLKAALASATEARTTESGENAETIKTAKEGLEAVQEAVLILKVFYKKAGKATVLLEASPVDEDTTGAGFAGAYQGKQEDPKGIIGMLQVIASDFDRTARLTKIAEDQAHAEFVEFDRISKADISGKDTKKQLDEEDLKTTRNTLEQTMGDLQDAQSLLDAALKVLEDLKPTCIDTGMSYADRLAKREEEVAALKKALCILDPTPSVEAGCTGGLPNQR